MKKARKSIDEKAAHKWAGERLAADFEVEEFCYENYEYGLTVDAHMEGQRLGYRRGKAAAKKGKQ